MRAALLGVKHPHSLAHLRTLAVLDEIEAIYLWDESQTAVDNMVLDQRDKIAGTFTDLDELLRRDDLFFVVASVANNLGPEIFESALRAGKHVLAEKPIGRNAGETEQVIAAAEESGCTLGVLYMNRSRPLVEKVRGLLSRRLIGELMSAECRMLTTQVRFRDPAHWLFNRERSGGGMLSWLGCHDIDRLRYVTGDEVVSVQAQVATRGGEEIDVEDIASVSMQLDSGAIASYHAGYVLTMSGFGYMNSGYDTYCAFNGRLGRIVWSSSTGADRLFVETTHPAWATAPQRRFDYTPAVSASYGGVYGERFVSDFIASARQGSPPIASGSDALQVARIVDASYESDRSGRRITIATPGA